MLGRESTDYLLFDFNKEGPRTHVCSLQIYLLALQKLFSECDLGSPGDPKDHKKSPHGQTTGGRMLLFAFSLSAQPICIYLLTPELSSEPLLCYCLPVYSVNNPSDKSLTPK